MATGAPSRIPGVPVGFRASQIPDPKVKIGFLDMFGRPPRESPCECERTSDVSLSQTLNMINGPTVAEAIIHPEGRVAKLIAAKADDKTIVSVSGRGGQPQRSGTGPDVGPDQQPGIPVQPVTG